MKPNDIKINTEQALAEANAASNAADLENVRIKYLGRNGLLPQIMKELKDLDASEKPDAGKYANELKNKLTELIDSKKAVLDQSAGPKAAGFDISLPGNWRGYGSIHPVSAVISEVIRIFSRAGFTVAEGPDIENKFNNFDALNTPDYHPSLDQTDTFWLDSDKLLRTQTSPVQIRVMQAQRPPIRIITPGRCYRRDTTDATHSANFHQAEGLYVDKRVSLADLKGILAYFAAEMMGPGVKVRFRPHFFPFTEPSVECDFSCHVCSGKGCKVCKNSGWIEIAGAGMVDPRVFKKVGIDADDFTGYAFGMGIERIAMIKFGIPDIRMIYENDIRFLEQFV